MGVVDDPVEGTGQIALAGPAGAGDEDVLLVANPLAAHQTQHERAIETPRALEVEIFDGPGQVEAGQLQEPGEPTVIAVGSSRSSSSARRSSKVRPSRSFLVDVTPPCRQCPRHDRQNCTILNSKPMARRSQNRAATDTMPIWFRTEIAPSTLPCSSGGSAGGPRPSACAGPRTPQSRNLKLPASLRSVRPGRFASEPVDSLPPERLDGFLRNGWTDSPRMRSLPSSVT